MEKTKIFDYDDDPDGIPEALPEGTPLLDGKFSIDSLIGNGGFGITYLARDTYLERAVVIKECFPEVFCFRFGAQVSVRAKRYENQYRKTVEMFMREARSLAKLRHPNVVSVHQVFEENGTAYMVLDLIEGRDLADIIESGEDVLSPDQIHALTVKVLDAMTAVHGHDLLHRDISPDNILLDKWATPALIDFGAAIEDASKTSRDASSMLVVKDGYSPHEFYVSGAEHGPSSDLYALGATLYHLISGDTPVDSQTRVKALNNNGDDPCLPLAGRFPQFEDAFLAAIDTAMAVPSADRIQSAQDWMGRIEHEERKKVPTVNIPRSVGLEKTLSALVAETNKHVLSEPRAAQPAKENSAPVSVVQSRDSAFRPDWLDDFNRETQEQAAKEQSLAHSARKAAAALILQEKEQLAHEEDAAAVAAPYAPRSILGWVARTAAR